MPTTIDELAIDITANTRPFVTKLDAMSREASHFSGAITGAFKSAVAGGRDFGTVLDTLALKLADIAFGRAFQPVANLFGNTLQGAFGGGFARGGVIDQGVLKPFARGGILPGPMAFPMRGGVGLAGEAGPEAIMPLRRGSDGRLGVAAENTRAVSVTMNITSPDAGSFRKSEAQVTAMLARAVGRGRRGL